MSKYAVNYGIRRGIIVCCTLCLMRPAIANPDAYQKSADPLEWNFKVYLNDTEIGYHNFRLTETGGQQHLVTEADFKVKILFITAFKYKHVSRETWKESCLQKIDAHTNANGKSIVVRGLQEADGFKVESSEVAYEPTACAKTFAYWNREFLKDEMLLNAQSGEFTPIKVDLSGEESLTVRGQAISAQRYRLTAKNQTVDLWYSIDGRWIGLQTTMKNGRKLRYELA